MIIDTHTHVWPDDLAARAIGVAPPELELERPGDGKVSTLLASMDAAGIDMAVALGIALATRHLEATNQFASELDHQRFIGLGSIHADADPQTNIEGLRSRGLVGAKVNPLFQGFCLDDPGLWETLDAMQGEFVVVTHVGVGGPDAEANARCTPQMIRALVRRFPRLDLVAAHFGGYHQYQEALDEVIGLPVYVDTAWPPRVAEMGSDVTRDLIERHGPERVLFGSDWPTADPGRELAAIEALGLADTDLQAVIGGNAVRLFRTES